MVQKLLKGAGRHNKHLTGTDQTIIL